MAQDEDAENTDRQGESGKDAAVEALLERFVGDVRDALPLVALWAHGSLALGDFQPGRSDLDLIAVVAEDITGSQRDRLRTLHRALTRDEPLSAKLHCSYIATATLPETGHRHVTWAHQKLFARTVTEVSRRELALGGRCLYGPPPAELLPAVTDEELADFIRTELRGFWYPAAARRLDWLRDVWVDLGLVTVARATVTLRDGRLITKGEALDLLTAELDAPPSVVHDIRDRRYGCPGAARRRFDPRWRVERARLARTFVRTGIERALQE